MTIPEYITATDVQNRVTSDVYARWFARTTNGTVDTDFLALCITDACSQWNIWMGDTLPGDWTANGHAVDSLVKRRIVGLVLYFAAEAQPRGTAQDQGANPFQRMHDAAKELADQLRKGHEARLITAAVVQPKPQATLATVDNTDTSAASPYVRVADGAVTSGF